MSTATSCTARQVLLPPPLTLELATNASSRSRPAPTAANRRPASAGTDAHSQREAGWAEYSGQHNMYSGPVPAAGGATLRRQLLLAWAGQGSWPDDSCSATSTLNDVAHAHLSVSACGQGGVAAAPVCPLRCTRPARRQRPPQWRSRPTHSCRPPGPASMPIGAGISQLPNAAQSEGEGELASEWHSIEALAPSGRALEGGCFLLQAHVRSQLRFSEQRRAAGSWQRETFKRLLSRVFLIRAPTRLSHLNKRRSQASVLMTRWLWQ